MNAADERLGRWAAHAEIIRVVHRLRGLLEDGEPLTEKDYIRADNAICALLAACPAKVAEEVHQG